LAVAQVVEVHVDVRQRLDLEYSAAAALLIGAVAGSVRRTARLSPCMPSAPADAERHYPDAMAEVPSRRAAREAWAALPELVRRDALRQAAMGQAAADPGVAAIIVGMLRDRTPTRSWARRAATQVPFAAIGGCFVALQYFGLEALDTILATLVFVAFGFVVASAAITDLVRLFRRRFRRWARVDDEPPPATAELVNLRKVIDTAPVRIAQPLVVRGQPRVRGLLLTVGLVALMSLGFIVLLDAIRPEQGDINRLLQVNISFAFGAGAIAAWVSWGKHLRRLPVRIDDSGVRFGRAPVVGWSDVVHVFLVGPIPGAKKVKPVMTWTLRDKREIPLELGVLNELPEEIILAARAYKPELVTVR
jgi:hypothetical protein